MADGVGAGAQLEVPGGLQDGRESDADEARSVADAGAEDDTGGSQARAKEAWAGEEAGA